MSFTRCSNKQSTKLTYNTVIRRGELPVKQSTSDIYFVVDAVLMPRGEQLLYQGESSGVGDDRVREEQF